MIKEYSIMLLLVISLLLIPELMLEANLVIKILLIGAFISILHMTYFAINNFAEVMHIKKQLKDTNEFIKITCITFLYSLGYYMVNVL